MIPPFHAPDIRHLIEAAREIDADTLIHLAMDAEESILPAMLGLVSFGE